MRKKIPAPSWECEVWMRERIEIQIPEPLVEAVLRTAAQQELTVEEILESAIRNYLEGRTDNGR